MKIYAHRGLSQHAPENTMVAFQAAVTAGAEAIELDVQRTKDGQIVVMHDFYLGRTNQGSGLVMDHTYDQLQGLDMGAWFDPKFKGEKIPLLEEVMAQLPPHILINIELKKPAIDSQGDLGRKVVDIIHQYTRPVLVSAFDHYLLKQVQDLDPDLDLGLLYSSNLIDVFAYARQNGLKLKAIHPSIEYVSPPLVDRAHQLGLEVNVYTIRQIQEVDLLRSWGVDGIFVNTFEIVTKACNESAVHS